MTHVIRLVKATIQVWMAYLHAVFLNEYIFTSLDRQLHLKERLWALPELKTLTEEGDYLLLEIEGKRFFWPRAFRVNGLTWIYAEVFFSKKY